MKAIMYADLNEQQRALVDNNNSSTRFAAAVAGFGLDKLAHDWNAMVREEAERQGYVVDEPMRMMSEYERAVTRERLKRNGLEPAQSDYPPKLYSELSENERAVADHSRRTVRCVAAEQGWGLDKLVSDPDPNVRAAVAGRGFQADKLINDEHWYVRCAAATKVSKEALRALANDPEWIVRSFVAHRGECLDVLVNDPEPRVRATVARQGYGLEQLSKDPSMTVRLALQEMREEKARAEQTSLRKERAADARVEGFKLESDNMRVEIAGEAEDVAVSAVQEAAAQEREAAPRKPGELKSVKGKPKGAWFSGKFSLAADMRACIASAGARGAELRKPAVEQSKSQRQ